MWFARKKDVEDSVIQETVKEAFSSFDGEFDIASVSARDGRVQVVVNVNADKAMDAENYRQQAEGKISDIAGIQSAMVILTAERQEGAAVAEDPRQKMSQFTQELLPQVKNVIAVASGKGGVGKSTVSFNFAAALARAGYKVGLLDADIYGPSVPKISGLSGQKPEAVQDEKQKIQPLEAHGLKVMSIGFFVDEEAPLVWRGPKVQGALLQLIGEVDWGDLDYLIIDMPPGTGDVQLTLAQKVKLAGALIVSTPQDLALADARKGIEMFEKVDVPVLGVIENMSMFICPHCGEESDIFGCGSVKAEAEKRGVPFLGSIPLSAEIRQRCDAGEPVAIEMFDGLVQGLNLTEK